MSALATLNLWCYVVDCGPHNAMEVHDELRIQRLLKCGACKPWRDLELLLRRSDKYEKIPGSSWRSDLGSF
jgi:hypothetical protein